MPTDIDGLLHQSFQHWMTTNSNSLACGFIQPQMIGATCMDLQWTRVLISLLLYFTCCFLIVLLPAHGRMSWWKPQEWTSGQYQAILDALKSNLDKHELIVTPGWFWILDSNLISLAPPTSPSRQPTLLPLEEHDGIHQHTGPVCDTSVETASTNLGHTTKIIPNIKHHKTLTRNHVCRGFHIATI